MNEFVRKYDGFVKKKAERERLLTFRQYSRTGGAWGPIGEPKGIGSVPTTSSRSCINERIGLCQLHIPRVIQAFSERWAERSASSGRKTPKIKT
jgi:hypothetical protein